MVQWNVSVLVLHVSLLQDATALLAVVLLLVSVAS
jgi:hypothetical protein